MKKIGSYILLIVFLMIMIPLAILGGIGSGIKLPDVINKLTEIEDASPVYNADNGGPKIKIFDTEKNELNEMYLEEYIRGVVAAEMPASFELEALKAQAVAARTFAVAHMKGYGGNGCANHPEADVCTDVHCQAWVSKEERFKNWDPDNALGYWNKISEAVEATRGMVLSYNGQLASNVKYFSTSDGKTESSINVFNYAVPYLVSVNSPGEENAPKYSSTVSIKISDFVSKMKKLSPSIKISSKNLSAQIKILSRTEGNRVKTIKIGDKTFGGVDIRWAFLLNSADFTVKVDSKNVVFNVRGNGHGVGMSQFGANAMAKGSKKYDEILKHYYTGIEVVKMDQFLKGK